MHHRFGHQETENFINVVNKSVLKDIGPEKSNTLKGMERSLTRCQIFLQKPTRLKFNPGDREKVNRKVYVKVFYNDGSPSLHIDNEANHFRLAQWLSDMTFKRSGKHSTCSRSISIVVFQMT